MILVSQIKTKQVFKQSAIVDLERAQSYFKDYEGYRCVEPVKYELELKRVPRGIRFEAGILAKLSAPCQRCLTLKEIEVNTQCSLILVPQDKAPRDEEFSLSMDDLDIVYYEGDEIDADSLVLETVILELETRVLCHEDCLGLCAQCGQNLNLGTCECTEINFP